MARLVIHLVAIFAGIDDRTPCKNCQISRPFRRWRKDDAVFFVKPEMVILAALFDREYFFEISISRIENGGMHGRFLYDDVPFLEGERAIVEAHEFIVIARDSALDDPEHRPLIRHALHELQGTILYAKVVKNLGRAGDMILIDSLIPVTVSILEAV